MLYDELKQILSEDDVDKIYNILTSQGKPNEVVKTYRDQWDTAKHGVMDEKTRPKKSIKVGSGDGEALRDKVVEVGRVPVPFQKLITNKAVSFTFGNPVILSTESDDDERGKKLLKYIQNIFADNKIDTLNRIVMREICRATEAAEIWHVTEGAETHEDYGFKTKNRVRVTMVSPWDLTTQLYPFFDDHKDMIAFSRYYEVHNARYTPGVLYTSDMTDQLFECYTHEFTYRYRKNHDQGKWEKEEIQGVANPLPNRLKKIPVVYGSQEIAEWSDVQNAIERLETLFSNHADINDYNGSPSIVVSAQTLSLAQKGESGKVYQIDPGGKMEYLSWDHAPESIKLEIENLLNIIYDFTQTPNVSFSSLKGITSISGIALKLLFMDAHLKVMDKREILDPYQARRIKIIKAFLQLGLNDQALIETTKIKVEIKPFMIEDLKEWLSTLFTATGGKPILSQETAVGLSGLVKDPEAEFQLIEAEAEAARLAEESGATE